MPITMFHHDIPILSGEIEADDFLGYVKKNWKWFQGNFISRIYACQADDNYGPNKEKRRLAEFLPKLRGPYWVQEDPMTARGTNSERLGVTIFLPEDRDIFRNDFLKGLLAQDFKMPIYDEKVGNLESVIELDIIREFWSEKPTALDYNRVLLIRQTQEKFTYKNEAMQNLISALSAYPSNAPDQSQMDVIMHDLWGLTPLHPAGEPIRNATTLAL